MIFFLKGILKWVVDPYFRLLVPVGILFEFKQQFLLWLSHISFVDRKPTSMPWSLLGAKGRFHDAVHSCEHGYHNPYLPAFMGGFCEVLCQAHEWLAPIRLTVQMTLTTDCRIYIYFTLLS